MLKRIFTLFSALFAICIILTALPVLVSAETEGYYTYTITDGKAEITECDFDISGYITIPDTLGGYPVTSIGDKAFYCSYDLEGVTIPDSVTNIGDEAFYLCYNIKNITIPCNVTNIGDNVFFTALP